MLSKERISRLSALKRARDAEKELANERLLSSGRLEEKKSTMDQLMDAKKSLATQREAGRKTLNELAIAKTEKNTPFDKVRGTQGGGKGGLVWPTRVTQLVFEMLINGTPPQAIPLNIASQFALSSDNKEMTEVPSVNFIRRCRIALRIVGETVTAHRLAKAPKWDQLFTDGTSRRQVALQNLVISVLEDEELNPIIVSSAMIVEGESSEQQCKEIVKLLSNCLNRLSDWKKKIDQMFPGVAHDISHPIDVNLLKLSEGEQSQPTRAMLQGNCKVC